ncbi:MAG: hypothetical protein ACJAYU_001243 [Bradymonadia bacterium]|jgi:hypothetical protein
MSKLPRIPWPLALLSWASLLDLTTSMSRHTFDSIVGAHERPIWQLVLQIVLCAPLILHTIGHRDSIVATWKKFPASTATKALLTALMAVQLAHVAFRMEFYPFSAVAMFSNENVGEEPGVVESNAFMVREGDGWRPLALWREGNPIFQEWLDLDFKAGWALRMYATADAAAGGPGAVSVAEELRDAGAGDVAWGRFTYNRSTGEIHEVEPIIMLAQEGQ